MCGCFLHLQNAHTHILASATHHWHIRGDLLRATLCKAWERGGLRGLSFAADAWFWVGWASLGRVWEGWWETQQGGRENTGGGTLAKTTVLPAKRSEESRATQEHVATRKTGVQRKVTLESRVKPGNWVGCVAQGVGQHWLLRMQRSASTQPPGHNV